MAANMICPRCNKRRRTRKWGYCLECQRVFAQEARDRGTSKLHWTTTVAGTDRRAMAGLHDSILACRVELEAPNLAEGRRQVLLNSIETAERLLAEEGDPNGA